MYICMYIYIYIYIYIYKYFYIYIYIYIHTFICIHKCVCMYILFVDSKDADEVVSECLNISACQCMHIYLMYACYTCACFAGICS